jgi:hypothetical protein
MATLLANFGFSPKNNEWLCQDWKMDKSILDI